MSRVTVWRQHVVELEASDVWTPSLLLARRVSVHRRNILPARHLMTLTASHITYQHGWGHVDSDVR